jgi:hypothetical protein
MRKKFERSKWDATFLKKMMIKVLVRKKSTRKISVNKRIQEKN